MHKNALFFLSIFLPFSAFSSFWETSNTKTNRPSTQTETPASQAAYQELSYDDLIQEYKNAKTLRAKQEKRQVQNEKTSRAFGGMTISLANYEIDGENIQTSHQGFSVSYLKQFQPQISWGVEYKNLPYAKVKSARIEANEFDVNILYSSDFEDGISAQLSTGLATRFLGVDKDQSISTVLSTQFLIGAGAFYHPAQDWVVGLEPQWKSALFTKTADRTSIDVNLRVGARF